MIGKTLTAATSKIIEQISSPPVGQSMDELQSWVSHILPSLGEQDTGKTDDATDDPIDDSWELIDFVEDDDTETRNQDGQSSKDKHQLAEEQGSASTSQLDAKKGTTAGGILKQTKVDSLVQEDFDVVSIQKNLKVSFEIPDLVRQAQSLADELTADCSRVDTAKTLESSTTKNDDANEQSSENKQQDCGDNNQIEVGQDVKPSAKVAKNEKKKKKRRKRSSSGSVEQTTTEIVQQQQQTRVEVKSADKTKKKDPKKTGKDMDSKSGDATSSIAIDQSELPPDSEFCKLSGVDNFPKITELTSAGAVSPASGLSYAAVLATNKKNDDDDEDDEHRESPSGAIKRNRPVSTSSLSGDELDLLSSQPNPVRFVYCETNKIGLLNAKTPTNINERGRNVEDEDDCCERDSIASSDFSDFDCGIQAVNNYIMRSKRGHKKRTRSQSSLSEVLVQLKSRVGKKADSSKVSDKELSGKPGSSETKKGAQVSSSLSSPTTKYTKPINKKLARSASNPSVSQAAIVQIRGKQANVGANVSATRAVKVSSNPETKLATIEQPIGASEGGSISSCSASATGNDTSDYPEMDESWYVTPPPCFTGSKSSASLPKPEEAKEAARENALIEYPVVYLPARMRAQPLRPVQGPPVAKAQAAAKKALGDSNSNNKTAKKVAAKSGQQQKEPQQQWVAKFTEFCQNDKADLGKATKKNRNKRKRKL